jgi:hypothetical protein
MQSFLPQRRLALGCSGYKLICTRADVAASESMYWPLQIAISIASSIDRTKIDIPNRETKSGVALLGVREELFALFGAFLVVLLWLFLHGCSFFLTSARAKVT